MQSNPSSKEVFIDLSKKIYKTDPVEMKNISDFEKTYTTQVALQWYSRDSFLSRLLNKALRTQNIDILFYLRFFIDDIRTQLKTIKQNESTKVYRSQWMTANELKTLQDARGKFISINSFLSAHLDKLQARSSPPENKQYEEQVLFEIDADPKFVDCGSFANITGYTANRENEVLFMLGSIFEILQIKREGNRMWLIQLRLYPDHSQNISFMSNDTDKLLSFGYVLETIGKPKEAEGLYKFLLDKLPKVDPNSILCREALAGVADGKDDYDTSLRLYTEALNLNKQASNKSNLNIASNYNDIGEIYRKKRQYEDALLQHKKALEVLGEKPTGQYLAKQAVCYNSMGIVYQDMKEYQKALQYYMDAFEIRKEFFSFDKISLGMSSNNMGNAHYYLDHFEDAKYHYREALQYYKKQLPPNHPKIASTYNNIGALYDKQNELKKALTYYEDAKNIYRSIYSGSHPYVGKIQENIDLVKKKIPQ